MSFKIKIIIDIDSCSVIMFAFHSVCDTWLLLWIGIIFYVDGLGLLFLVLREVVSQILDGVVEVVGVSGVYWAGKDLFDRFDWVDAEKTALVLGDFLEDLGFFVEISKFGIFFVEIEGDVYLIFTWFGLYFHHLGVFLFGMGLVIFEITDLFIGKLD